MKTLKFNTSKGDFALMDGAEQIDQTLKALLEEYTTVAKVSEMSEEKFAEVVNKYKLCGFENYDKEGYLYLISAKDSFMSLLKSLGVFIYNNPIENIIYNEDEIGEFDYNFHLRTEAESKTFYNPILLKKI